MLPGLALLAFLVGYWRVGLIKGLNRASTKARLARPLVLPPDSLQRHWLAIVVFAAALIAMGTYLFRGLPPALSAFETLINPLGHEGIYGEVREARREITKGYVLGESAWRGQGLMLTVSAVAWPMLAIMALSVWFKVRNRKWAVTTIAVTVLMVVYVGGAGQRGPLMFSVLTVLYALSLLRRIHVRTLIVLGVGVIALTLLIIPLGQYTSVGTSIQTRAQVATQRIFLGNASNSVMVMELAESGKLPYGWGRVIGERIYSSLPGIQVREPFAYRLAQLREEGGGRTTYASTSYLGSWYADFGWPGVLLGFVATGAALAWVQTVLLRPHWTPLSVALAASAAGAASVLPSSSVRGGLVQGLTLYTLFRLLYWATEESDGRGSRYTAFASGIMSQVSRPPRPPGPRPASGRAWAQGHPRVVGSTGGVRHEG
jgi:hypothetical protein